MTDAPINLRKAIDFYSGIATGEVKKENFSKGAQFLYKSKPEGLALLKFMERTPSQLQNRVVSPICAQAMRQVGVGESQPRRLDSLQLPDSIMKHASHEHQVKALYQHRVAGSPFGTMVRGSFGYWFELQNSKNGQPNSKGVLGTGGRSQVRQALWWCQGQHQVRESQAVAVKKISTDYVWLNAQSEPTEEDTLPMVHNIQGFDAKVLQRKDVFFELYQAMKVPDDPSFLRPLDIAVFEASHPYLPPNSAFASSTKAYIFYPKYDCDLIELLNIYEQDSLERDRTHKIVAHGMLEGLKALEANEVAHMDIKPENFLYSPDKGVVLTDFGFAVSSVPRFSDERCLNQARLGTSFFCPEALDNGKWMGPLTHRQCHQRDLIAFAQSLYEMEHCDYFEPLQYAKTRQELAQEMVAIEGDIAPESASAVAFTIWENILLEGRDISLAQISDTQYFMEAKEIYEACFPVECNESN